MDFDQVLKGVENFDGSFFDLALAEPTLFQALWQMPERWTDIPLTRHLRSRREVFPTWSDTQVKKALKAFALSATGPLRVWRSLYDYCLRERRHLLARFEKGQKLGFEDVATRDRTPDLFVTILKRLSAEQGIGPRAAWESSKSLRQAVRTSGFTDNVFAALGIEKHGGKKRGQKPKIAELPEKGEATIRYFLNMTGFKNRRSSDKAVARLAGKVFCKRLVESLMEVGCFGYEQDLLVKLIVGKTLTVSDVWMCEERHLVAFWQVVLLDRGFLERHRAGLLKVADLCPLFLRAGIQAGFSYVEDTIPAGRAQGSTEMRGDSKGSTAVLECEYSVNVDFNTDCRVEGLPA